MSEIGSIRARIGSRLPANVNRLSPVIIRQRVVDQIELDFTDSMMNIAARVLGKKAVPLVPRTNDNCLMSREYRDVSIALTSTYESLIQLHGHGIENRRVADLLTRRDSLRVRLNELNRSDQAAQYRGWKDEFESLPIAQRLKVTNRSVRRRSAAGACLSSTPLALESYKDHFKAQFTNDFGMEPFEEIPSTLLPHAEIGLVAQTFPLDLVSRCISKSPRGKAPGLSGFSSELMHPVVDLVAPVLSSMFCVYMALSMVPSSWKRALLCPVPKKGDLSRISNYRPISLTEVTRKIYEMCVLDRLRAEIPLSLEQGGFREGRSTLDQVESLDMLIKASRRSGKKVHLAFLDIKAAYDSVPRSVLWRRCEELEMDTLTLATLRSLFDHNSAQLIVSQKRSPPFALPAGVLQGSVLSPLLYSIYLDPLVDKLRRHGPRMSLPLNATEGINAFLYADDIALVATSSRDLSRLLRLAEEDSIARGYRFSPAKCVVVSQDAARQRLYNSDLAR